MSEPMFLNDSLNRPAIEALMLKRGLKRLKTSSFEFGNDLDYMRIGESLYYHPGQFLLRFDYAILWLRAGVEINEGWHWKTEIYQSYWDLGIETTADLMNFLSRYI